MNAMVVHYNVSLLFHLAKNVVMNVLYAYVHPITSIRNNAEKKENTDIALGKKQNDNWKRQIDR